MSVAVPGPDAPQERRQLQCWFSPMPEACLKDHGTTLFRRHCLRGRNGACGGVGGKLQEILLVVKDMLGRQAHADMPNLANINAKLAGHPVSDVEWVVNEAVLPTAHTKRAEITEFDLMAAVARLKVKRFAHMDVELVIKPRAGRQ